MRYALFLCCLASLAAGQEASEYHFYAKVSCFDVGMRYVWCEDGRTQWMPDEVPVTLAPLPDRIPEVPN